MKWLARLEVGFVIFILCFSVSGLIMADWMDNIEKRVKAIETQLADDQIYHSPIASISDEQFKQMAQAACVRKEASDFVKLQSKGLLGLEECQ